MAKKNGSAKKCMIIPPNSQLGQPVSDEVRRECKCTRVDSFIFHTEGTATKLKLWVWHDEQSCIKALVPVHANPDELTLLVPPWMLNSIRTAMIASNWEYVHYAVKDPKLVVSDPSRGKFPRDWSEYLVPQSDVK